MTAANLAGIVSYHARLRPRSVALADARERIDFARLATRVNRLANALVRAGIRHGDRVAIRLAGSHRHFECLFACAKLGAIMVPINPKAPPAELDQIFSRCAPSLVFDSAAAFDAAVEEASESEPAQTGTADDPLLIMHTSGTTGVPKGVVLTQSNVIFTCFNQILGWQLTARDRALVVAPLHHVGGLLAMGLPCLYAGGEMRLGSPTPENIAETIERARVTALFLPPTLWVQLAQSAALDKRDRASVRLCASGGDPVPRPVLEHLREKFHAEFTDAYGLTEAASAVTILGGDDVIRRAGSAGKTLAHVRIRIVDTSGSALPPNQSGDIALSGPMVMKGYWNDPDATSAALRDGWLMTGDRGSIDEDGFLYVSGRAAEAMGSAGSEVYPSEVERVIREHPRVADAAVFETIDAGDRRIIAALVAHPGITLAPQEVLDFCAGKLPPIKRPQTAVLCDALPRNASGKVMRAALRTLSEAAGQRR